ncbi:MAG: hypothetical protein M0036_19090 [Desulfobacteraceae bacterium]|nr:hypothetical protein [Desulfobacteraceae bacterium]
MKAPDRERYSTFGRPFKYSPDVVLTEIIVPNFPLDLDQRLNALCEEKGVSRVDFVHDLILKEVQSKKLLSKYPLEKSSKTGKKNFRRIPNADWVEFQIRSLYYNTMPVNLLLQTIQEAVLVFEGQGGMLRKYHQPIDIESFGPMNFSPKLPKPIYDALYALASFMSEPAHTFINWLVNQMDEKTIKKLRPFGFPLGEYAEPRLDSVDRKTWIAFRSQCLRMGLPTHDLLASYLLDTIISTIEKKSDDKLKKEIVSILKPYLPSKK